jgi:hypothetical protein
MTNLVDAPKDNPLAVKLTKRFMTWDEFLSQIGPEDDNITQVIEADGRPEGHAPARSG